MFQVNLRRKVSQDHEGINIYVFLFLHFPLSKKCALFLQSLFSYPKKGIRGDGEERTHSPATATFAVRLIIDPEPPRDASHWYSPSSGLWCLEWNMFWINRDPFGSCCFRSSSPKARWMPSFLHLITGTPRSDSAEQFRTTFPPRIVTASEGSAKKRSDVKASIWKPETRKHKETRSPT